MRKILLGILNFYQKFLTLFSFGSCRYYPTCSEYSKWQFKHNSIIKAFYYTIVRILKCNQLFDGGFDYPVIERKFTNILYKKIDVKYWFVPKVQQKNNYLILKTIGFNNGN